jgi:uncharacterized membrane protein SpoIIM required for sporulation/uncharacterized RDD family membrane protein YckC
MSDFRQHLEIETPEHVVVDYEIAGLGSRALAALVDGLIILASFIALGVTVALSRSILPGFGLFLLIVGFFALAWGYFALFEGLWRGQTPGKRFVGIRVMRESGHAVTFRDAAARNLVRVIDFLPPPYLLGAALVALHPRAKRLGDIVAGTVVVRDRPTESAFFEADAEPEPVEATAEAPQLVEEEFRILREFDGRSHSLPPDTRARLATRLAERFAQRYPNRDRDDAAFLAALFRDESARRRGRLGAAALASGGGVVRRRGGAIGERFVTAKRARWLEFHRLADRASKRGLDSFTASELPDFARRYREVAADLARARTYRVQPDTVLQLERIVAAGHNALYRDERKTWSLVWHFFARECPAAVVRARRYVLVAFLAFALPAVAGFVMLRERPSLADEVLPVSLLERADEGARLRSSGAGYAQTVASSRPLAATAIITNNVGVAFVCFASGVLLGIGSLVALAFNGALLGATSGHYANRDLLGYLWTFVAGHGVLELFAIWVAGAAGLLLGRAIIAPGDLTRRDALVLNGRLAMALIGTTIVLLLIAGLVEGLVSTSPAPVPVKLSVSVMSVVFLALYLARGRSEPTNGQADATSGAVIPGDARSPDPLSYKDSRDSSFRSE